jgi:sRNA-binding carbon storage regulator CsrA
MAGLIITRARGEQITIGETTIDYLGVNKFNEAVIQIVAPRHVKIMRVEKKKVRK